MNKIAASSNLFLTQSFMQQAMNATRPAIALEVSNNQISATEQVTSIEKKSDPIHLPLVNLEPLARTENDLFIPYTSQESMLSNENVIARQPTYIICSESKSPSDDEEEITVLHVTTNKIINDMLILKTALAAREVSLLDLFSLDSFSATTNLSAPYLPSEVAAVDPQTIDDTQQASLSTSETNSTS